MYDEFFRLRENPFNVNPDPRYLFLTRQTAEARDGLKHAIQARKGLLLLTGEVGTGKTTLLNHLLDWLHQQRAPTAFICNSHLEISHLFDFMLSDFAVKFDAGLKDNFLLRLHQWLWERYRAGDTPVVIVDEAQGLPDRVLEEIRMLLNLETSNEKLLQIVLAGQPELEARLQQPGLRQVKQRIALRCKTAALSLDETRQYIQTRLHIAGADSPRIFASDAVDAVHFYSGGIPRVMNLLCEHALINASAARTQPIPPRFVAEVASEFHFDDRKPLGDSSTVAQGPRSNETPAQSRFLNPLVSLSTADEHESPAPEILHPCASPAQHWHAAADNVFSPVQESATPHSHPITFQDAAADAAGHKSLSVAPPFPLAFERSFAARSAEAVAAISEHAIALPLERNVAAPSEPCDVQPVAPVAPWHRQLEARLLADWTSFFSEVGSSLASDPAAEPVPEPVPATHSPRLHLVDTKPASTGLSAASRPQGPKSQNSARLSSGAGAKKSFAPITALENLVALRTIVVAWTSNLSARLRPSVTAAARSRAILVNRASDVRDRVVLRVASIARSGTLARITQISARCLSVSKSLYWECLACADRCLTVAASIDWTQLWLTASTWLRQPCDPTQWRLQSVRPFHDLLRFNHKKT